MGIQTSVRNATRADHAAVSATLARAFYDDPVFSFLLPDDTTRLAKLDAVLGIFFKMGLPHGTCYTTANYESVTLWRPPNGWHVPFWAYIVNGPKLLSTFGGNLFRSLAVVDMMETSERTSCPGRRSRCVNSRGEVPRPTVKTSTAMLDFRISTMSSAKVMAGPP